MPEQEVNVSLKDALLSIGVVVAFILIAMLCCGGFFGLGVWTTVPAGAVGVPDTMGNVDQNEMYSGLHFKHPLKNVALFDARTMKFESDDIIGTTTEGMQITVHATVFYHIDSSKADEIYKTMGTDYQDKVVYPEIRGAIYDEIGKYTAESLYKERNVLATPTKDKLNVVLNQRGITVESVVIRSIILPDKLRQSIEDKQTMEQDIQKKKYEVEKEQAEADRKRIEAQGIADSNDIISQKLTPEYLEWYWIEKVGASDNTIYVTDGSGMPAFVKDV
jgi:regulator of protease activity HflC (stomatin/prohibitin superfamily)